MYFKRSLQLFPSCCAALLDSRKSVAGLAHSAVERGALSQTWREPDMREGGCRKGALVPKDQSLSCHLLTGLKSFNLSWKVGVIIQAYSHEVLMGIIDLFDLEKCLINKQAK